MVKKSFVTKSTAISFALGASFVFLLAVLPVVSGPVVGAMAAVRNVIDPNKVAK